MAVLAEVIFVDSRQVSSVLLLDDWVELRVVEGVIHTLSDHCELIFKRLVDAFFFFNFFTRMDDG